MPCFTASNIRFTSAKEQLEAPQGKQQATKRKPAQVAYVDYAPLLQAKRPDCIKLFRPKGAARYQLLRQQKLQQRPTLPPKELERLRSSAKYITVEERLAALERQENLEQLLDEQAERARAHFKRIDDERKLAEQLKAATETKQEESSTIAEQQQLLEKAFIEKHEQEEEVKAVNRVILNAKCLAILDAQMQERREIEERDLKEKQRLERMLLDGVKKELENQDCHDEALKQRQAYYAAEIREQLETRAGIRVMEAERLEEEARAQRKVNEFLRREEELEARAAHERRLKYREQLNGVVEMSNLFKKMLCEQEREADLRIAAYLRDKRKREKELEHEKQLAKEAFERKQQRLYQLAEKRRDSQSAQEEAILLREQERVEREYRQGELALAMRKKRIEREMKEARQRQLQETKSRQALQIAREEKNFNALIENLKKEEARLQQKEAERAQQRKCYRAAIIKQIGDKVMANRRLMEDERRGASAWLEAERQRLDNIRVVVNAKLAAMRDACMPQRYILDVERQLQRIIKANVPATVA